MKPGFTSHRIAALTITEVLIVIAALALLTAILLPALATAKRKSSKLSCTTQLKQIGVAYRMWADNYSDKFPMQISVTNGGAMESIATGNVAACFKVLSNIIDNPAILICPQDAKHFPATNFDGLSNSNISYFVNLGAVDVQTRTLLSGDDNLVINDKKVQSGILHLRANDSLGWTEERHRGTGNILSGDSSVLQVASADLASAIGDTTNRLVIP